MLKIYQKVIRKNVAYIFECPMSTTATDKQIKEFTMYVQQYVQNKFPSRGYNLYMETNMDMLGVVVVLDANNLSAVEVVD